MIVISAFSLSTGNLIDSFRGKGRSFTSIFIASNILNEIIQANFFGIGNQMLILSEGTLRLKASGVMQRGEDRGNPKDTAWPGLFTA
jgi:hypothetical protein